MDELTVVREFRLADAAGDGAKEHARRALSAAIDRRRVRRRYAVVVAALVGLVLLVSAAYGIVRALRVGEPAPPEVRQALVRFGHEAELIPIPQSPQLDARNARVAATLDSSVGRVDLFSVPAGSAQVCGWLWIEAKRTYDGRPDVSSVCGEARRESFFGFFGDSVGGRHVMLFEGHAAARVARVVLRIRGRDVTVPLVGRWFLAELVARPAAFFSYNADGRVLERHVIPWSLPSHPRRHRVPHRLGPKRLVLTIRSPDTGGLIRLSLARSSTGGRCVYVSSGKKRSFGCDGFEHGAIGVAPMQLGGAPGGIQLLVGPLSPKIARLDVRYEDGRVARMPLRAGWTLYEVVRADYVKGRRPAVLVGRDRSGKVIARKRLPWSG
jgi:hypothetical protein